jgi:hypothetical protein
MAFGSRPRAVGFSVKMKVLLRKIDETEADGAIEV